MRTETGGSDMKMETKMGGNEGRDNKMDGNENVDEWKRRWK